MGTEIHSLFESGEALREAHVDPETGIVSNVALLGQVSANKRRYAAKAMQDAVRLYPGVRMFIDHPTEHELEDRRGTRSIKDLCGKVMSTRMSGGQVRGDVQIVGPHKAMILEIAASMPELFGLSHRAKGKVKPDGSGGMIVESLESVQAVEFVSEPATTHGLFESVSRPTDEAIGARLLEAHIASSDISEVFLGTLRLATTMADVDTLIADRKYIISLRGGATLQASRAREDLFGARIAADLSDGEFSEAVDRLFGIDRTRITWNAELLELVGKGESAIDLDEADARLFGSCRNGRKT